MIELFGPGVNPPVVGGRGGGGSDGFARAAGGGSDGNPFGVDDSDHNGHYMPIVPKQKQK